MKKITFYNSIGVPYKDGKFSVEENAETIVLVTRLYLDIVHLKPSFCMVENESGEITMFSTSSDSKSILISVKGF